MPVVSTESKNVRVAKTTSALRQNEFNEYYFKYYVGFPQPSNYNVCKPSSSSIFMTPNRFYSFKTAKDGSDPINGNPGCDS